jgi:hypothetical protein
MSENSEKFISQVLKESYPDLDLNPLTPAYDILVRLPASTYVDQILSLVEKTNQNRSLLNFNMSEIEYDQLLANWFFQRLPATRTLITVRLYFSDKLDIEIPNTLEMTINNNTYNPINTRLYSMLDFKLREDGEAWYIDVNSISTTTGPLNIGINQNVSITIPNDKYLGAEVISINSVGTNAETNAQAYYRLQSELGIKNLVNNRSIYQALSENYSDLITSVFIAGYSEVEQVRDIITTQIPKKVVRLFFSEKINLFIPSNTQFVMDGTSVYYINKNPVTIAANSTDWQETPDGTKFYVDVPITLTVQNPFGFQEDYLAISSYLQTQYPSYLSASFQTNIDKEATLKVGGKTDIFVRTITEREVISINVPGNTDGYINIPSQYTPLLKVHSVYVQDGNESTPIDIISIVPLDSTLRFSAKEKVQLFVDVALAAGREIFIDLTYSPFIRELQEFFSSEDKKVLGEDILCRYMNPIFLDIIMIVSGDESETDLVKQAITSYVNDIPINQNTNLIKSEMIKAVANQVSLTTLFSDTIIIFAEQHLPNGEIVELETLDIIQSVTRPELGVSPRNSCFIINKIDVIYK